MAGTVQCVMCNKFPCVWNSDAGSLDIVSDRECEMFRNATNRDIMSRMTNDEISVILDCACPPIEICPRIEADAWSEHHVDGNDCVRHWKAWLQQPAAITDAWLSGYVSRVAASGGM